MEMLCYYKVNIIRRGFGNQKIKKEWLLDSKEHTEFHDSIVNVIIKLYI